MSLLVKYWLFIGIGAAVMKSLQNWTGMSSLNLFLGVVLMPLAFPILLVVYLLLLLVAYGLCWTLLISATARQCLNLRVEELVAKATELNPLK